MESTLITAPDLDHSNRFKVMLVDFSWEEITVVAELLDRSKITATLYTYCHNEDDSSWCITAAKTSDAVLVNCRFISNIEMLKGYLLSIPQAAAYGTNSQSLMSRVTYHDLAVWLTEVIKYYTSQTRGQDGIRN